MPVSEKQMYKAPVLVPVCVYFVFHVSLRLFVSFDVHK